MRLFALTLAFLVAGLGPAATAQPTAPPPDDIPLEVVPLVDMNAPLVLVWFSESSEVGLDDANSAESQVFEEIGKRMDLRVFSRGKTVGLVTETGDPGLAQCNWETDCLIGIGRLAEADQVIGVKMSGSPEQYYLTFKRIELRRDPMSKATRMVSGSLSKLLLSGVADTVTELLAAPTKPIGRAAIAAAQPPEPGAEPAAAAKRPAPPPRARPIVPPPAPRAQLLEPEPRDEQPEAPEQPGFFRRHLGSTIALGASLACAGIGIGFGVMSSQIQQDIEFQYDPVRDQDGRDNALAANVLFGLAGAAAVTALILFLFEPGADQASVTIQPVASGALVRF